jgi:Fe-Mn family superoxide dismutase
MSTVTRERKAQHALPELPYALDALEPKISAQTLQYHHGKHHRGYVTKLNELIQDTEFAELALEDIVRRSSGAVFNNAAQAWNHAFYWQCLAPVKGRQRPSAKLAKAIDTRFGSLESFKDRFTQVAVDTFGSGWTWLVLDRDGSISVGSTSNAGTPIRTHGVPLLTCDVWEHAYYIDYRNERLKYVEAFWDLANWDFVNRNYEAAL